ncbi:hypothetical protein VNO77_27434 [Canavalia gladiata]|uniref:Uncharacterized protein n=1 Tax=Canavalia gladiata TaxID=3824 RepID=A0AAN9KWY1_CANGL
MSGQISEENLQPKTYIGTELEQFLLIRFRGYHGPNLSCYGRNLFPWPVCCYQDMAYSHEDSLKRKEGKHLEFNSSFITVILFFVPGSKEYRPVEASSMSSCFLATMAALAEIVEEISILLLNKREVEREIYLVIWGLWALRGGVWVMNFVPKRCASDSMVHICRFVLIPMSIFYPSSRAFSGVVRIVTRFTSASTVFMGRSRTYKLTKKGNSQACLYLISWFECLLSNQESATKYPEMPSLDSVNASCYMVFPTATYPPRRDCLVSYSMV